MALEEFKESRKSKTTAFSLSPNIISKLEEMTASGTYGNRSAIVSQALVEFFTKEGVVDQKEIVLEIVRDFLRSSEGESIVRNIMIKSISLDGSNQDNSNKKYYNLME